jgi:hypothetical protein
MTAWLVLILTLSSAVAVDPRESLKEVCFVGKSDPNCSTVSRNKLTRRHRGRITVKPLTKQQYKEARKAIEKFQVKATNAGGCQEPVEIADFVGESLVRVQSYCAPTNVVRNLKKRL